MLRSSDRVTEKSISEISKEDQIVEVYARVAGKDPFTINDGSGLAIVNGACSFEEGDLLLVIGRVTILKGSTMPVIDPFIIKEVSRLDLDLYNQLKQIKAKIITERGDGK